MNLLWYHSLIDHDIRRMAANLRIFCWVGKSQCWNIMSSTSSATSPSFKLHCSANSREFSGTSFSCNCRAKNPISLSFSSRSFFNDAICCVCCRIIFRRSVLLRDNGAPASQSIFRFFTVTISLVPGADIFPSRLDRFLSSCTRKQRQKPCGTSEELKKHRWATAGARRLSFYINTIGFPKKKRKKRIFSSFFQ